MEGQTVFLTQIRKRDGRIVSFDKSKITTAIFKAAQSVGGSDLAKAQELTEKVADLLNQKKTIPAVEEVQDAVEKVLINEGHAKTAKAFILYRQKHSDDRQLRELLLGGVRTSLKLSLNSLAVLKERYLLKDINGNVVESPEQLFRRVAKHIAKSDVEGEEFYQTMSSLEFIPGTPTLMNSGTELGQLASCFVIPIDDSIESIFEAVKCQSIIQKCGGGTGFNFSRLRPKNEFVKNHNGVASGPVNFMKVFDATAESIKQGGKRKGANMAVLRVDHPDILDFITIKEDNKSLQNFNISVALTEKFMEAAEKNEDYELINPKNNKFVKKINAKHVLDLIVLMSWKTGDPGILFIDRINNSRSNPAPELGQIECTSPCGELPMFSNESANLGSINVSKMFFDKKVDWEKLKKTIHIAIKFLDNVIDVNKFPIQQFEQVSKANRRIGLGVMGFAELLYKLEISYDSEEGVSFARELMSFISKEADNASIDLAKIKGSFPNFNKSIYKGSTFLRNSTRTTISPTGTISMIADCSSGIEPLYALSFTKTALENKEMIYVNETFESIAKKKDFYSEELMKKIANRGTIQDIPEIPEDVKKVFKTSHDISPYWHVKMQAAFQEFTDNAVSKTVNFPNWATTRDVEEAFILAYKLGCKGITAYRDKSKEIQILNVSIENTQQQTKELISITKIEEIKESCPECNNKLTFSNGCATCEKCSYSICSLG